jgi:flagellin-like protein
MQRGRSRRALSPVIATIILIAVTVAVSLAVAIWMGALTTGFMTTSSITVIQTYFNSNATMSLYLKNAGTKQVTIGQVKVNTVPVTYFDPSVATMSPGTYANMTITPVGGWTKGNPYKFDLYDTSGNLVGSYQANSPGS